MNRQALSMTFRPQGFHLVVEGDHSLLAITRPLIRNHGHIVWKDRTGRGWLVMMTDGSIWHAFRLHGPHGPERVWVGWTRQHTHSYARLLRNLNSYLMATA